MSPSANVADKATPKQQLEGNFHRVNMLTIGTIVDNLDKEGKKPGSPSYFKAVKSAILFHFEIEEKSLSDVGDQKLISQAKGIAQKCKDLYGTSSSNIKKMFSTDQNKVRLFVCLLFLTPFKGLTKSCQRKDRQWRRVEK